MDINVNWQDFKLLNIDSSYVSTDDFYHLVTLKNGLVVSCKVLRDDGEDVLDFERNFKERYFLLGRLDKGLK